jgi:hypothetical protein
MAFILRLFLIAWRRVMPLMVPGAALSMLPCIIEPEHCNIGSKAAISAPLHSSMFIVIVATHGMKQLMRSVGPRFTSGFLEFPLMNFVINSLSHLMTWLHGFGIGNALFKVLLDILMFAMDSSTSHFDMLMHLSLTPLRIHFVKYSKMILPHHNKLQH